MVQQRQMNTKDDIIRTCPLNQTIMHCEPANFQQHKEQAANQLQNFALFFAAVAIGLIQTIWSLNISGQNAHFL